MSSSEIFITKRDGKRERFSIDKIRAAIAKAFLSVGSFATDEMLTQILGRIRVADGTTVEQIQNQVETAPTSSTGRNIPKTAKCATSCNS